MIPAPDAVQRKRSAALRRSSDAVPTRDLSGEVLREIAPVGIEFADKLELPRPPPSLQAALASPDFQRRWIFLEIDKACDAVAFGKFRKLLLVLGYPSHQIVGYADV